MDVYSEEVERLGWKNTIYSKHQYVTLGSHDGLWALENYDESIRFVP